MCIRDRCVRHVEIPSTGRLEHALQFGSTMRAMARQHTPTIRLRIDLSPDSALGPGKIALLEHIETSGSLSQAARELGMSYRRAWLLLNDINGMFSEPATTAVSYTHLTLPTSDLV